MWWLPVFAWAIFFILVLLYAWRSIAKDRYYARVEQAKVLNKPIPERPWYVDFRLRDRR